MFRRALVVRIIAIAVPTLLAVVLSSTRLHISSDLSTLFPSKGEAAALARYARAFGGGDVALVLVRGDDPDDVAGATRALSESLAKAPSVSGVIDHAELPAPDPTRAWLYAGEAARARLARALTPDGMAERLAGSRELLLSPVRPPDAEAILAHDPLRLSLVPWEGKSELAAGLTITPSGEFAADGGKARLLVTLPKGRAFDSDAAHAFVSDFDQARATVSAAHHVSIGVTGGHAINVALQSLFIRDLALSGTLSLILASVTFLVTFRRARALIAVIPPLIIGTVWTMGLAALLPSGLSAISVAFAAVVVGVGVDTGVHVYAALLDGRSRGLDPFAAAAYARKHTTRPTLLAAVAAGAAFASLALSELRALRELGLLCGVGEVLTSVAILVLTPEIGAYLERAPYTPKEGATSPLIRALSSISTTRGRALGVAALACVPVIALAVLGWPSSANAVVVLRPQHTAPLETQRAIFDTFGGRPGQWVVMSIDHDPTAARDRADAIAEALEPLRDSGDIEGFDALATFAPGETLARKRLAARDALDLPSLRPRLEAALDKADFDTAACAPALEAFEHPSAPQTADAPAWIRARHLAEDAGDTLAVVYVRPTGERAKDQRVIDAIHAADPGAIVTGYARLETDLKATLAHDLPRIGIVALVLVIAALGASLRSVRDVFLAASTLVVAISVVALAMRVLHVPWHAYDALVVPVLLGITMDEAMFLLYAARDKSIEHSLRVQGPLVLATALTTSAGFAALLACKFEGLFDVGAVGAIGSVAGVIAALLVIPAGLALSSSTETPRRDPQPSPPA